MCIWGGVTIPMTGSLDPTGHIKLMVSDFQKSKEFYGKLFDYLDYKQVAEKESVIAWVTPEGFGIWVAQADISDYEYKLGSPGMHHFCFKAESKQAVNDLYEFLLKENVLVFDKPAAYPQYTKNYYAVYFADPDGIKLEWAYY